MGGIHASVIAYGENGSGKSYALAGSSGAPGVVQVSPVQFRW